MDGVTVCEWIHSLRRINGAAEELVALNKAPTEAKAASTDP